MNKYILIFVEGETEVEFYQNYIIPHIKSLIPCDTSCWKVINVKGIGGFKVDAIQKFKKIYSDNSDYDFYVILCYDTDVFEYASEVNQLNGIVLKKELKTLIIKNKL